MFIWWGTKEVQSKLGYVADYCLICRGARAFQLKRLGLAQHIYYLHLGRGKLLGFHRTCESCGVPYETEAINYTGVERRKLPPEQLQAKTHPALPVRWRERLILEKKIHAGQPLSPETRANLLVEPFQVLLPLADSHKTPFFDKIAGLGCLSTLIVPASVVSVLGLRPPLDDKVGVALFAVGTLFTVIACFTAVGRYQRNYVNRWLARALAPLRPEPHELPAGVDLAQALAEAPPHPGPGMEPAPDSVDGEELRRKALERPFLDVSQQVEDRIAQGLTFDRPAGLGCLASLLLPALFLYLTGGPPGGPAFDEAGARALGLFVLLGLYTLVQMHWAPGRHLRRAVLPPLAQELSALRPLPGDLSGTLHKLKGIHMEVGKLKLDHLMQAVHAAPDPPATPAVYLEIAQTPLHSLRARALEAVEEIDNLPFAQAEHLLEAGRPQDAARLLHQHMPALALSPQAHELLAWCAEVTRDVRGAERERRLAESCRQEIRQSGDGSEERPYRVVVPYDAIALLPPGDYEVYTEGAALWRVAHEDGSEVWCSATVDC